MAKFPLLLMLIIFSFREVTFASINLKINNDSLNNFVMNPIISSTLTSTCNNQKEITLSAEPKDLNFHYVWLIYNSSSGQYNPILNSDSSYFKTKISGFYKVRITNNLGSTEISPQFELKYYTQIKFFDQYGNTSITASPNDIVNLMVKFDGPTGPISFTINDQTATLSYTIDQSNLSFPVKVDQNRNYSIYSINSSSCGTSFSSNSYSIKTIQPPSITLNQPSGTNVCSGQSIDVSINKFGNWFENESRIRISLLKIDPNNTNIGSGDIFGSIGSVEVPKSLPIGTQFRLKAKGVLPNTVETSFSSFVYTVTSIGCSPKAKISVAYPEVSNYGCEVVYLNTNPNSFLVPHTYEWYLNDQLIPEFTDSFIQAKKTGNYRVRIKNSSGYDSFSDPFIVKIIGFKAEILSDNPSFCDEMDNVVELQAYPKGNQYTYKWTYPYVNMLYDYAKDFLKARFVSDFYSVKISDGKCQSNSEYFGVKRFFDLTMTDLNGNKFNMDINNGDPANIKVNFLGGSGPYEFIINYGSKKKIIHTNENPYVFTDFPDQSTNYWISQASNSCGKEKNGELISTINVKVNPKPTLELIPPANLNICAGQVLEIPFNKLGIWGASSKIVGDLVSEDGWSTYQSFTSDLGDKIRIPISRSLSLGLKFKVKIVVLNPYLESNSIVSSFVFNVNSSNCYPTSVKISKENSGCEYLDRLIVEYFPNISFKYEWFLNGSLLTSESKNYLDVVNSGYYYSKLTNIVTGEVLISNTILGEKKGISKILNIVGESCFNNGQSQLSVYHIDGNTYNWYYSERLGGFSKIPNQSQNLLITNKGGTYYCEIENTGCVVKTNEVTTCGFFSNIGNLSACKGEEIKFTYYSSLYYNNPNYIIQLYNSISEEIVVESLEYYNKNLISNNLYEVTLKIPSFISPGQYKFRIVLASPYLASPISQGVFTLRDEIVPEKPNYNLNILNINNKSNSLITANNCPQGILWSDFDVSYPMKKIEPLVSQIYYARCVGSNGCLSGKDSLKVNVICDVNEPNNTYENSTIISTLPLNSQEFCLENSIDTDFFKWNYFGKDYYISIKPTNEIQKVKTYKLNISNIDRVLKVSVLPGLENDSYYCTITLIDSDKSTILKENYGYTFSNGNLNIQYQLPCPSKLFLPNAISGVSDVIYKGLVIESNSIITNLGKTFFQGQNSINLNEGFSVEPNSGVFLAEIKNCN